MKARTRSSKREINGTKQQFIKNLLLFSVSEAALIMGCSDRKVFDLIRDGKIMAAGGRPGNKGIRITGNSLEEYIESITIDPEFWQR